MIKKSKGTHRVSLFIEINATVYFDSFGIQYIPQKVKINQLLTLYLEYKMIILLCGILLYRFHIVYECRKNVVRLY